MGIVSASDTSLAATQGSSTSDELHVPGSTIFSDSLKDLKSLRGQLYSAAEYFELSYTNDDQKQKVVSTLKDYAIQALVNTVDHLGSISYKVNGLLDEKVDEVFGTEFRVTCIEQRIRTCQIYMDHEGLSQQSLVITAPRYHKHYILSGGKSMRSGNDAAIYHALSHEHKDDWHVRSSVGSVSNREIRTSSIRKSRFPSPSLRRGKSTVSDKISVSSLSISRSLSRSGSRSSSRTTSPVPSAAPQNSQIGMKSFSVRAPADKDSHKEIEQIPSKSKRLFKALMGRRKVNDDPALYSYLDEY